MKVLIAGGGTGGHLYPGIAIAREFLAEPGNEVLFVGTELGIEARVLPREGLPVRFITAGKIKGMDLLSIAKTGVRMPQSLFQSVRLLKSFRPDVVVGIGGYTSGPVGFASWMLKIPLIIIEPNSFPGLANRLLGKIANVVVLSFPGSNQAGFFPQAKIVLTGPIVRKGLDQGDRDRAVKEFKLDSGKFTILVFGGSGGAHAINMAMKEAAQFLNKRRVQILHQTGERDHDEVSSAYQTTGLSSRVLPYIYDMAAAYAVADLVVSRSGATTVAELAFCGKRAVLVPFPFAADNHQEYNAKALAARGAAEVILQKDLRAESLAATIQKYSEGNHAAVVRMGPGAAEYVVTISRSYVQKN